VAKQSRYAKFARLAELKERERMKAEEDLVTLPEMCYPPSDSSESEQPTPLFSFSPVIHSSSVLHAAPAATDATAIESPQLPQFHTILVLPPPLPIAPFPTPHITPPTPPHQELLRILTALANQALSTPATLQPENQWAADGSVVLEKTPFTRTSSDPYLGWMGGESDGLGAGGYFSRSV
jgi:hypothetical protein